MHEHHNLYAKVSKWLETRSLALLILVANAVRLGQLGFSFTSLHGFRFASDKAHVPTNTELKCILKTIIGRNKPAVPFAND